MWPSRVRGLHWYAASCIDTSKRKLHKVNLTGFLNFPLTVVRHVSRGVQEQRGIGIWDDSWESLTFPPVCGYWVGPTKTRWHKIWIIITVFCIIWISFQYYPIVAIEILIFLKSCNRATEQDILGKINLEVRYPHQSGKTILLKYDVNINYCGEIL